MAGMPQSILDRANLLLKQLEEERSSDSSLKNDIGRAAARDNFQLSMFALEDPVLIRIRDGLRSDEHTSELQSLMRISYAVFCLKHKKHKQTIVTNNRHRFTMYQTEP